MNKKKIISLTSFILIIMLGTIMLSGCSKNKEQEVPEAPKLTPAQKELMQERKKMHEEKHQEIMLKRDFNQYILSANKKLISKDFKGALDDCNKAISLSPDEKRGYFCRVKAKTGLKDHEGVQEDLDIIKGLKK